MSHRATDVRESIAIALNFQSTPIFGVSFTGHTCCRKRATFRPAAVFSVSIIVDMVPENTISFADTPSNCNAYEFCKT